MPVRCPYCGEDIPTLEFAEHHKICRPGKEGINIERLFHLIIKKEIPEATYRRLIDIEVIDLPRDHQLHGTTIAFKCERSKCSAEGDVIVYPELVNMVTEDLKKIGCVAKEVHRHELLLAEAHIHIECKDMEESTIRRLLNYIKEYYLAGKLERWW